ncbi:Rrf2 family transcriptional regulator, partial [Nocardia wallacei]|uniref:Rrf2 family transcriptional regulator n=1 Tax=Nocardia wallacei TaxID=480035 RepID=UPI00313B6D09
MAARRWSPSAVPARGAAVHISARVDYAVRILLEIARAQSDSVKADTISAAQSIPPKILESTAAELRRAR